MSFVPASDPDDDSVDESTDKADETGEVAEMPEGDNRELPLTDVSEMHRAMIESTASQDDLEAIESAVEVLRDEIDVLREHTLKGLRDDVDGLYERTAEQLRDTDELEGIGRVLEALRYDLDELRTET